jgi:lysophospholipase L1-like esterase
MFCRSWSVVNVTGGGDEGVCAIADGEAPEIESRQVTTSGNLGEKGTRMLQSDMISGVFEKLSTSGIHAKPFVMKRARGFFATIGFLLNWGCLEPSPLWAAPRAAQTWVTSWGSSQQIPEPQNELPVDDLRDATVRQIFHLSVGGSGLRVHMSNAFGTEALHFTSVHIARPLSASPPAIDPSSDRQLTFAEKPDVVVPPGAEYISDPIRWDVAPLSDLAVTFHLDIPPVRETGHPGSRATSYYVHGDSTGAATLIEPKHVDHWFQISEIDVQATPQAAAIVVLGDSITDGHGATTNGNDRWTDVLAARLQSLPETRSIGVSNQGIGGNHLLTDGLGPNVLSRFDRDVLAPAGVRWLIVFEGVNDLGGLARNGEVPAADHAALVGRVLAAYRQIVERAHAHGLHVFGATITPYVGSEYYHPGPLSEADRQAVNQWIRGASHFDGVIDFDRVVRDPNHPDQLLPAFDCGDHLHPSPAGYKAMGDSIVLTAFSQSLFRARLSLH